MSPRKGSARGSAAKRQMRQHVVGVDPGGDAVALKVLRYRTAHVYPYLRRQGFQVTAFTGRKASRLSVSAALSNPGTGYVTGGGHGEHDSYHGRKNQPPIFQVGGYAAAEVRGRIVHLLACLTALNLGADFVRNGARAFFGYSDNFTFDLAERDAFLDCDAEIDRGFADGLTADAVFDRATQRFVQEVNRLRTAKRTSYKASMLENDLAALRAPRLHKRWGKGTARLR